MKTLSFKNQHVRDLAWALSSPALMHASGTPCKWYDDGWYRQVYRESADWLCGLEQSPAALADIIRQDKDRRLGRYFELLWAFWFEHSDRFDIIGQNIQIEHEGRTAGELDLVVHEHATGKNIHIELAVKFYLGLGDTQQPANWFGPNKKDRLDIKLDSLLKRQSILSRQDYARHALSSMGIHIDACAVILKGRLFYPGVSNDFTAIPQHSNPAHLKSIWLHQHQLAQLEPLTYRPQRSRGWLAGCMPESDEKMYTKDDIMAALASGELELPLNLTGYRNVQEKIRLFVVADSWSTTLYSHSSCSGKNYVNEN